jgi:CBS domain-containing protein
MKYATAQDIMTSEVITVAPEARVEQAAAALLQYRVTCLPVVDAGGNVVGMVNDHDVIGAEGHTAQEIMTTQVITVSPDTSLEEVSHILKHLYRVPVVQAGRLVGLVSRTDLLKCIAQRWTCSVCGALVFDHAAPRLCTECGASSDAFGLMDEPPMMYRDM